MNSWLSYADGDSVDGNDTFWLKYLYIKAGDSEMCINLWTLDLLNITPELHRQVEWDSVDVMYSFEDALDTKYATINGISGTWKDHIKRLKNSKKLRDVVFNSSVVKILTNYEIDNTFLLEYRLVYDPDIPKTDKVWDRESCVNLRHRIFFDISLKNNTGVSLFLDKGRRGFPNIKPIGWYPTREMDGALISQKKALPIPKINHIKPLK
tara:strand:- start:27136 stop:27762 length:627 start_codon:yes stop_codon:yes gene_type:complete